MNAQIKGSLSVVAGVWLLAGCEGTLPEKPVDPAPVTDRTDQSTTDRTAPDPNEGRAQGMPSGGAASWSDLDDRDKLVSKRIIYFDYDSDEIKPEYRAVVEAHAQFLTDLPDAKVVLEGHADERGSREYNIALGERRALSVRRLLSLLGTAESQMQTISFGEERPQEQGSTESAYSRNRRVEFVYTPR